MKRPGSGKRGFALILTLVVTALMVAVAVELVHQVYVDTSLTRAFRDGQQASILAESGIKGGIELVKKGTPDMWAKPLKLEDEVGTIEITVTDESGKINLNDILVNPDNPNSALNMMRHLKVPDRLKVPNEGWSALAAWIKPPNNNTRPSGAENAYYLSQKPPYSAANSPLTTLTELSLVKGFQPESLAALRPFVTIYGTAPKALVNINTAPKEVIMALDGVDDRLADRIIEQRQLLPFKSVGELSRVPGSGTLSSALVGIVDVKGTIFRITSIARVKETARTVEAVVDVGGNKILSWQEY